MTSIARRALFFVALAAAAALVAWFVADGPRPASQPGAVVEAPRPPRLPPVARPSGAPAVRVVVGGRYDVPVRLEIERDGRRDVVARARTQGPTAAVLEIPRGPLAPGARAFVALDFPLATPVLAQVELTPPPAKPVELALPPTGAVIFVVERLAPDERGVYGDVVLTLDESGPPPAVLTNQDELTLVAPTTRVPWIGLGLRLRAWFRPRAPDVVVEPVVFDGPTSPGGTTTVVLAPKGAKPVVIGRLKDAAGASPKFASIWAEREDDGEWRHASILPTNPAADGRFEIRAAPPGDEPLRLRVMLAGCCEFLPFARGDAEFVGVLPARAFARMAGSVQLPKDMLPHEVGVRVVGAGAPAGLGLFQQRRGRPELWEFRSDVLTPGTVAVEVVVPGCVKPLARVEDVKLVVGSTSKDPRLDPVRVGDVGPTSVFSVGTDRVACVRLTEPGRYRLVCGVQFSGGRGTPVATVRVVEFVATDPPSDVDVEFDVEPAPVEKALRDLSR